MWSVLFLFKQHENMIFRKVMNYIPRGETVITSSSESIKASWIEGSWRTWLCERISWSYSQGLSEPLYLVSAHCNKELHLCDRKTLTLPEEISTCTIWKERCWIFSFNAKKMAAAVWIWGRVTGGLDRLEVWLSTSFFHGWFYFHYVESLEATNDVPPQPMEVMRLLCCLWSSLHA